LAGRLIQQVGEEFKDAPARMISALKAFHHAKELVAKEGGAPRIALAASLLLEVAVPSAAEAGAVDGLNLQKVTTMLQEAGADEQTIKGVCEIIGCRQTGKEHDSIEFTVVCDAGRLAQLTTEYSPDEHGKLDNAIQNQLVTDTAKQRARSWCQAVDVGTE